MDMIELAEPRGRELRMLAREQYRLAIAALNDPEVWRAWEASRRREEAVAVARAMRRNRIGRQAARALSAKDETP